MATSRIPKPAAPAASGNDARIKELKAQLERDPFNINVRLMLSAAYDAAGKVADALKLTEDTVEKAKRNLGISLSTLANLLKKSGKPDEGLSKLDAATQVDPANATFYLALKAEALRSMGLNDRASAVFQELARRRDLAKETRRIVLQNLDDLMK